MIDKPRSPRRPAGEGQRRTPRGAAGGRPAPQGRSAGKPVKGPRPGRPSGIDERTLARLAEEGLLTAEGRKTLRTGPGAGDRSRPRLQAPRPAFRKGKPVGEGPHPGRRLDPAEAEVAQRLQKVMAQAGVASRRHSEELIQAGRVTVNGKVVTELGTKVVPGRDLVEVDGRPLGRPENLVYILLNKPKGYVTTLYDPQGRPKVTDLLEAAVAERVYPVGRLDFDTEGLLLLTNDGQLANALMHPAHQVKKTYIAKVRGVPGPAKLRALETGIELDDGPTAPAEVKLIEVKPPNAATVSIRIHEGRNRQVRRMFEAVGHEVIHLKRTTLGPLHLKDLPLGQWRELGERELRELKAAAGLQPTKAAVVAGIVDRRKEVVRRSTGRRMPAAQETREAREDSLPPPTPRRSARPKGPRP